jgi:hypothetical protein
MNYTHFFNYQDEGTKKMLHFSFRIKNLIFILAIQNNCGFLSNVNLFKAFSVVETV